MLPAELVRPVPLVQVVAPDVLLRSISQEVVGRINLDAGLQAGDPAKVAALIETRILPLFDFDRMTQSAMARNWRLATPAQQRALIGEFRKLLVRTYAAVLANYDDEIVSVRDVRAAPDDAEVTVKSDVKGSGRGKTSLDCDMERTPAGWRIYDVKLAGVRLTTTYGEAFAEKVRESGIEGLIKSLAETNLQGDSRFNRIKPSLWEKSRVMFAILRDMLQRQH